MKRVLEVITFLGSAEKFIGEQFSYFQENGDYEMHLICTNDTKLSKFAQKHNIFYEGVEIPRQFSLKKFFNAIFQISRYIRRNKIDIVIAHYFPMCSLITTFANILAGNRCKIIVAHGVLHDTMHGLMRKIVIWEQKFDVFFAKKVVCVSNSVARRRIEDGVEKTEKQVVLGMGSANGVETQNKFNPRVVSSEIIENLKSKLGITPKDFIVGFTGRLVHDKGVEELCGAMRLLNKKWPNKSIKLLVIGPAEKRDALTSDTMDYLNNSGNVILTGPVPYDEIQNYYMLMDLFVLPSYREGFPTVVLEACAMDIPAIVSRSTGCIDSILDGVTGLYSEISPVDIAKKIEMFFDNDYRQSFTKRTRQHIVENYDQRIIRKYMLDVLNSIDKQ